MIAPKIEYSPTLRVLRLSQPIERLADRDKVNLYLQLAQELGITQKLVSARETAAMKIIDDQINEIGGFTS